MSAEKLHADDTPVHVLRRATAKRRWDGCGPTCVTTGRRAIRHRRRCGSSTHRIAKANTQSSTCRASAVSCRLTPTPGSLTSTKTAEFRKRRVGRTFEGNSTTFRSHTGRPGSSRTDRGLVCHRERDSRSSTQRVARSVPSPRATAAGLVARMVGGLLDQAVAKIGHDGSDEVRAGPLAGPGELRA